MYYGLFLPEKGIEIKRIDWMGVDGVVFFWHRLVAELRDLPDQCFGFDWSTSKTKKNEMIWIIIQQPHEKFGAEIN